MSFIVAIDGPAGSGKGTITSKVAKKFNLTYLDTGATYRCVAKKFLDEKVDYKDTEKIKSILKEIKIEFKDDKVFLDGEDVTKAIREPDVTKTVSEVSHILEVRLAMSDLQRKMGEKQDSILEGRDIGTYVFPNADVKIYLDASVEERVRRRVKQNKEKGIDMSEEEVRENIVKRDEQDKAADIGALKQAEDAIYIDSSNMSINQVVRKISKIVRKAKNNARRIAKGYKMRKETWHKKAMRSFVKFVLHAVYCMFYRVKQTGKEDLNNNKDEAFIICANHLNYLDAAVIVLFTRRRIRFVAKADLYRKLMLSWLGHLFDMIPVKRDSGDLASIKMCLKCLKDKQVLGIFPEGTRRGMEKNVDNKNGAVFLADKANVKIIPVGIGGTFKLFSTVYVNYGKPIDVKEFKDANDPNWMDKATEKVMSEIVLLSKKKGK